MTLPPLPPLQPVPKYVPACELDPQFFDMDVSQQDSRRFIGHAKAVRNAQALCDECALLEPCKVYAREHPDVRGVIAGEYRPQSTGGYLRRHSI